MMNLGLKLTFPRLYNTVVKKRELIIEEVHIITPYGKNRLKKCAKNYICENAFGGLDLGGKFEKCDREYSCL